MEGVSVKYGAFTALTDLTFHVDDGEILGIRDPFLHDTGAYDPYGLTVPLNSQCTVIGPYRVPAYESELLPV